MRFGGHFTQMYSFSGMKHFSGIRPGGAAVGAYAFLFWKETASARARRSLQGSPWVEIHHDVAVRQVFGYPYLLVCNGVLRKGN
jgi:hypothetical protein